MKKILYLIVILIVGQSCQDYLKEEIISDVTADSYYSTPAGFQDAVKAAYEPLRSFFGRERGMTLSVFGTDDFTMGSDGGWKFMNEYSTQLDPRNGFLRDMWNDFYRAINQTNAVVGRAQLIQGVAEDVKTKRVAEARFLRALYYFYLVETFGPVHFTLDETKGVELEANRTPVLEIYEKGIIPDLEFAVANLDISPSDYGRASKPAAEHLLAKVHLTRGYLQGAPAGDFQKAADYAKKVITEYGFELLPDWGAIWNINSEKNKEVVWAVQYTSDPITNGPGNNAHLFFLMEYDVLPGMKRDLVNGRPWKRFMPTNYLINSYNKELDSRYAKGFNHLYKANNETNIPKWTQAEVDKGYVSADKLNKPKFALGDTAVFLPAYEMPQDEQARKPYMVISPSEYTPKLYPTLIKYLDPLRPDLTDERGRRDFLLMRLAETYLIAAEALVKAGKPEEAVPFVNAVRRRAAWSGKETEMEITASDLNLTFILEERSRELAGEMHRWYDLKRTGTLVERVKLYNNDAKDNIKQFHNLRPIPQDQIDRTVNPYAQNEGY